MFLLRLASNILDISGSSSKFHYVSIKIFPAHTSLHPGIHSKFHYVSIKMQGRRRGNYPGTGSKFHYVSIKMANRTNQYKGAKATLNSTMFLLRSPLRPFKIPSLIPLNSTMFLLRLETLCLFYNLLHCL